MNNSVFTYLDPFVGEFSFQPFDIEQHSPLLHQWVNQEHAQFWGMRGYNLAKVKATQKALRQDGIEVFLGTHNGAPKCLMELYKPQDTELSEHMPLEDGDVGMHILISQPDGAPQKGFTLGVFHCIMQFLLIECGANRVIVEPDTRNHKVHALNRKVGFFHFAEVDLKNAGKTSLLAYCNAQQYQLAAERYLATAKPQQPTLIEQQHWERANRHLVKKAIAEFSHERLLAPQSQSQLLFSLKNDRGAEYCFTAKLLPLEHWSINPDSIVRTLHGKHATLSIVDFILEFQAELGISTDLLPTYIEEVSSTLFGAAWKLQHQPASSQDLVTAGFQKVEQAMFEGHPCFIANSGKIGFDSDDFARYAPESGAGIQLFWIAVSKQRAEFSTTADISQSELTRQTLDISLARAFEAVLVGHKLSPSDYLMMPVHPWQWHNQLQRLFAGELASKDIVPLGACEEVYYAQQSIRTFFNAGRPTAPYIKCALSILNMGFMRGLSSSYMAVTPAINQWVYDTIRADAYLQSLPFNILREHSAIGYKHANFDQGPLQKTPYNKMLASLWRESPIPLSEPNQTQITMASLLHVDRDGDAFLAKLINASGLDTERWLTGYLKAYLNPLLHCFYQHHMVFMPHGENLILLLEDHAPIGAFLKDIGEEVCLLNTDTTLPPTVERIRVSVPHHVELLSIFTDVFDCFFRFLSEILEEHCDYEATRFWALVAHCISNYQASQPQLSKRFEEHDIYSSTFALSCLNRLQLQNNKQMVDLLDPALALQFAGELDNPISQYAPEASLKQANG